MKKTEDFYALEKNIIQLKEQMDELQLSGESGKKEKISKIKTGSIRTSKIPMSTGRKMTGP